MTALMKVHSSPPDLADVISSERARLDALPTDQLLAELAEATRMTAAHMLRLALVVRTLEERGEDLSGLKIRLMAYLRRIAYGQVLAEVVVWASERPVIVQKVAALPLPFQRDLADGLPVKMVVRDGDGFTNRMADPLMMTSSQVNQVFGPGRIRDEAEQILILEDRRPRKPDRSVAHVHADLRRGGITVGRSFVPAADAFRALGELYPATRDAGERTATLAVPLSEAEHGHLKDLASGSGISMAVLVRRALMREGLIPG